MVVFCVVLGLATCWFGFILKQRCVFVYYYVSPKPTNSLWFCITHEQPVDNDIDSNLVEHANTFLRQTILAARATVWAHTVLDFLCITLTV